MLTDKAAIIESICEAIDQGDQSAAVAVAKEYPFSRQTVAGRSYSVLKATRVFARDGFIDRYAGTRLVNPVVLRTLSRTFPEVFPFQKNWKIAETHPAYWELIPTIDHVIPVAQGGEDCESNWVTTSMLRNSAKANWKLDELGWSLLPVGDLAHWDGLSRWLIRHVEKQDTVNQEPYVIRWYRAARVVLR